MRISANNLLFFTLFLAVCMVSACNGNSEEEEKSAIDQFTEETASKAVHYIQDPLDKAQAVQALSDQYSEKIENTIEKEK